MIDFFKNYKDLRFLDFVIAATLGYSFYRRTNCFGSAGGGDIRLYERIDYEYHWIPREFGRDVNHAYGVKQYHQDLNKIKDVKDQLILKERLQYIKFIKDILDSRIPDFGYRWAMVCYNDLFKVNNVSPEQECRALAYVLWDSRFCEESCLEFKELIRAIMIKYPDQQVEELFKYAKN